MAPIIRTVNLSKVYRVGNEKVIALNDVNLAIEPGEVCCIVGASGSGKSTLLNQLAGLEKPTRGQVFIGKHEISAMTENELAKFRQAHLGFIFQSYNLLPNLTAAENVALPLMFKGMPRKARLKLAKGMALCLEFKLGSEILRTVVVRDLSEIAIVGAIIVLRAALTFLLHWEIKNEEAEAEAALNEEFREIKAQAAARGCSCDPHSHAKAAVQEQEKQD